MSEVLRVEMDDASVWVVDPEPIARDRANYYMVKDGFEVGSDEWQSEYDYTLNDEAELIDWAKNNMEWGDLKAVMVREPQPAYSEGWLDAHVSLVEKDKV
jgi:hypothetical protein